MKNRYMPATFLCVFLLITMLASCRRLIETGVPVNQLTTNNVFTDDKSATAVLGNIYYSFNTFIAGNYNVNIALYTDELVYASTVNNQKEFSNSAVSPVNASNLNIWKYFYSVIYQCNALLENLNHSKGITDSTRQLLSGEARFLRAYGYFYLVNLYGDVPLLMSTDAATTSVSARSSVASVYLQIIQDLQSSVSLLPSGYPSAEKVRANKLAAIALLAKVYLYQQNYAAAETQASLVINSGRYALENIPDVFIKGSRETIVQCWTQNGFTSLAASFIAGSGTPQYVINMNLYNAFEPGDKRKTNWLKSNSAQVFFPFKYKNNSLTTGSNGEYLILQRLSEQYLIRAEARAVQNNIAGALADINTIRTRAGLAATTAGDQQNLLAVIERERRVELFAEWGDRFLDAKRYKHIDSLLKPLKPVWVSTNALLPVPQNELQNNPYLQQNPGY